MNKLLYAAPCVVLAALLGCEKKETPTTSQELSKLQEVVAVSKPQKPSYAAEDWRRDFASTFERSKEKTDSDGITSYQACFEPAGDKCGIFLSGVNDGFRKADHLTAPLTAFHGMTVKYAEKGGAYVDLRVVAQQCKEAVAVLNPVVHAKSWLFMSEIAFMADGAVIYEQTAPSQAVNRDTDDGRIVESWSFKLDPGDYEKLDKFAESKSKVVRVTGDKGYYTLSKDSVDVFTKDVMSTIKATKLVNDSLTKGGGPECTSA
ncbi:hypothetical protein LZ683_10555 [Comamonas testosteroni]|uniref:hypothetical protein n=1 Tax=Comamonas testosteroni TaxID=285 RepID=UPI0023AA9F8D|nr:hypothetical protein [Comamonas testosteroni]WEE79764.1 hypothetical protein LZ683_10555 [Comamonas testosteroni]